MNEVEKRKDTDMYLIAAYIANGARLIRDEVTTVGHGRKLLVVEGEVGIFVQTEADWYAPDREVQEFPANILKRYKIAIQDVKALIHSSDKD